MKTFLFSLLFALPIVALLQEPSADEFDAQDQTPFHLNTIGSNIFNLDLELRTGGELVAAFNTSGGFMRMVEDEDCFLTIDWEGAGFYGFKSFNQVSNIVLETHLRPSVEQTNGHWRISFK